MKLNKLTLNRIDPSEILKKKQMLIIRGGKLCCYFECYDGRDGTECDVDPYKVYDSIADWCLGGWMMTCW